MVRCARARSFFLLDAQSSRRMGSACIDQLSRKPILALDRRRVATLHQVRLARHAAPGCCQFDEGFSGRDAVVLEQIVVLAPKVRAGLPGAVPGAIPVELAVGILEHGKQLLDLARSRHGRRLGWSHAGPEQDKKEKYRFHWSGRNSRIGRLDELFACVTPNAKRLATAKLPPGCDPKASHVNESNNRNGDHAGNKANNSELPGCCLLLRSGFGWHRSSSGGGAPNTIAGILARLTVIQLAVQPICKRSCSFGKAPRRGSSRAMQPISIASAWP